MANEITSATRVRKMKAIIKDSLHFHRLATTLQQFSERANFVDLSFICARGQRVNAHKLCMSSVSLKLKKMFLELPDYIEWITIHLPDIEARLVNLLMEFIYKGSVIVDMEYFDDFERLWDLLGIDIEFSSERAIQPRETVIQLRTKTPSSLQPKPAPGQFQDKQVYRQAPNTQGQIQSMLTPPTSLPHGQAMRVGPIPASSLQSQVKQVAQQTKKKPQSVVMSTAYQFSAPQTVPQQGPSTSEVVHSGTNNTLSNGAGSLAPMPDMFRILKKHFSDDSIQNLTARKIRRILELEQGKDLSHKEKLIEQVLKDIQKRAEEDKCDNVAGSASSSSDAVRESSARPKRKKKITICYDDYSDVDYSNDDCSDVDCSNDDYNDEDFDPKRKLKKSKRKNKNKK